MILMSRSDLSQLPQRNFRSQEPFYSMTLVSLFLQVDYGLPYRFPNITLLGTEISKRIAKNAIDSKIPKNIIISYFETATSKIQILLHSHLTLLGMMLKQDNQKLILHRHYSSEKPLPQCNMDFVRDLLVTLFPMTSNSNEIFLSSTSKYCIPRMLS